jgi:uncharacterized membrane protein
MSTSPPAHSGSLMRFGVFAEFAYFGSLFFLVAVATLAKVVQFYDFRISDWDTGIYSNVVWNLVSGDGFYSDINTANQLGEHFSPIVLAFVPLFLIAPSPLWLLAAQGLAVGATYVLIYCIGLKIFGDANLRLARPLALLFAIWTFFYRPLTSALLFQFHPSTLATPLVAAALLALLYGRDRLIWVLVGVLLLSKENAPLAVLGLACYAGVVLSRPRLGLALAAVAAASAALIMKVLMPLFQSGEWGHYGRLGPFAEWHRKAQYLYALLKGLAFLPLASWRSLVCALPLVALNLSVAYPAQFSLNYHYDDFASVFVLVAAMHGVVEIGSALQGWHVGFKYVVAIIAVILVQPPSTSALNYLLAHRPGDAEWQLHQELASIRDLPRSVGIAADDILGPYLSARDRYVPIRMPADVPAVTRLKPGDKVAITPLRRPERFAAMERLLREVPGLVKVHASLVLHVYEVTAVRPP